MISDARESIGASIEFSAASGSRPRNPWIAGLLALAFGSVAQVYCGRLRRAIIWALLSAVLSVVIGGLLLYFPYGRVAWFTSAVLFLMYYLGLVFDAVLLALRREPALQWYQRWWLYIGYCVLVTSANAGLAQIYRSQLGEAFHLLSGSMEQTLLPGDFLLVDTLHYRLGPIERGDVVAFWSDVSIGNPDQHTVVAGQRVLVKRVVGIPGDSIELRDELLYRNGAPVEEPYAVFSPMPTLEHFPMELRDTAPFVVPDGEYFVMGDNRRNSLDSRMFGCVRQEDMVGKVAIVYWSREAARVAPIDPRVGMNLQPGPPRRIRWERFGQRFE